MSFVKIDYKELKSLNKYFIFNNRHIIFWINKTSKIYEIKNITFYQRLLHLIS